MSTPEGTNAEPAADTRAGKRLTSSRRSFLAVGGTAVGAGVVASALHRKAPDVLDRLADRLAPASVTEDALGTTVIVRRPKDQCYVTLAYFNMKPDYSADPPTLVKKVNGIGCSVLVHFGDVRYPAPMHVAEQAYPLVAPHLDGSAQQGPHQQGPTVSAPEHSTPVGNPPIPARSAGAAGWPSRSRTTGCRCRSTPRTCSTSSGCHWWSCRTPCRHSTRRRRTASFRAASGNPPPQPER